MEALIALGVASNVVQIVDFGTRITKRCIDIYSSNTGLSRELVSIKDLADDLNALSMKLGSSLRTDVPVGPLSVDDQALYNLATKCKASTERLLAMLDKLTMQQSGGVLKSLRKNLKIERYRRDVEAVSNEMVSYREELNTRVLLDLKAKLDVASIRQTSAFSKLNNDIQDFVESLAQDRKVFLQQHVTLEELHQRMRVHNSTEHEQTRSLVHKVAEELEVMRIQSRKQIINFDDQEIQRQLRESLYFPEHVKRQDEIPNAHRNTFKWIFEPDQARPRPFSSFVEWLRGGSGIYWIKGKAGAGKSTLMNFIWEEQQTKNLLSDWAESCPCVCARYFFWHGGSTMQQSLTGLLRSLIFQILEQHPSLSATCFPSENEVYRILDPKGGAESIFWTEKRLKTMLKGLLDRMSNTVKVFFLVDGLDEINEDQHGLLVDLIANTTQNNKIKACVSSRALSTFEDAFSGFPQLRLQDLTFNDITAYVNDNLRNNSLFRETEPEEEYQKNSLLRQITSNSCGVFLWTKLVVRIVLDCLKNYHALSAIREEVNSLPQELEKLYEKMLEDIRKNNLDFKNFSKTCQIIVACRRHVSAELEGYTPSISPLDIAFGLSEDLATSVVEPARTKPAAFLADQYEITKLRVVRQSRGLLEIVKTRKNPRHSLSREGASAWDMGRPNIYVTAETGEIDAEHVAIEWDYFNREEVTFFHKSVSDFLLNPCVWEKLCNVTYKTEFDADRAILASTLMQLKSCIFRTGDLRILTERVFACAREAERTTNQTNEEALDELDQILGRLLSGVTGAEESAASRHWAQSLQGWNFPSPFIAEHRNFLSYSMWQGAIKYTTKKVSRSGYKSLFTESGCPLLHFCFGWSRFVEREFIGTMLREEETELYDTVKALFNLGADPNYDFQGLTAWEQFLHYAFEHMDGWDFEDIGPLIPLAHLMLQKNVNLHTTIRRPLLKTDLGANWVEMTAFWIFDKVFGETSTGYKSLRKLFLQAGCKPEAKYSDSRPFDLKDDEFMWDKLSMDSSDRMVSS